MIFTLAIVATVLVYTWFIEGRGEDRRHVATAIVVGLAIWHDVKHRAHAQRVSHGDDGLD